jgi:phosphonoacetate hydrolase
MQQSITVNNRSYAWPRRPVVVVCIDGSEPDYPESDGGGYIDQAIQAGVMPYLAKALVNGTQRLADAVVPSFTNPNNISIVTGAPPSVHGICGNFFYDRDADAEVMMNDPALLRAPTLFQAFQQAGAKIAIVTAKDKLRGLLGHGLSYGHDDTVCFSAEKADQVTRQQNGIDDVLTMVDKPVPSVYSADLSEFVFAAGVKLMERFRPDIMYLSTTDYIQHKHAPGTPVANAFYSMMDRYWGQLDALGAVLALTADHGMKAKHNSQAQVNVVYLQTLLDDWLGQGHSRVILPITDPYVVHHGALGGYATAYLPADTDIPALLGRIAALDGIECALSKANACERFELPEDRLGDIVVISQHDFTLGSRPEKHDLAGLKEPLRSHGGLSEQRVPFILNQPTPDLDPQRRLRNFDIFDAALNFAH